LAQADLEPEKISVGYRSDRFRSSHAATAFSVIGALGRLSESKVQQWPGDAYPDDKIVAQ
jgi:hypothetical protein